MFDKPVIKKPPEIPLPDPSVDPEWYGQIWIKYPMSPTPFSTYFGHMFKATAELRIIMNEICLQCFGKSQPSTQLTSDQALDFHFQLKDWYDNLPGSFTPGRIVFPSQFMLQ